MIILSEYIFLRMFSKSIFFLTLRVKFEETSTNIMLITTVTFQTWIYIYRYRGTKQISNCLKSVWYL